MCDFTIHRFHPVDLMRPLFAISCCLFLFGGCYVNYEKAKKTGPGSDSDTQIILRGSWNSKDKTRFLEITEGGSVLLSKKDSPNEEIGFYEIDGETIRIYKDRNNQEGRTEIARFEIVSDNEIVFGENSEYWNVVNISGRWFREGTDIKKVLAKKEYDKLTPEQQHLLDTRKQRQVVEELIRKLDTDRQSYAIKLSKLDEEKNAESWKLNASLLLETRQNLAAADRRLKKLDRAIESLEALVTRKKRTQDLKDAGLDEKGLEEILRSIKVSESELPIKGDSSTFELKSLVEEELQELKKEE